MTSKQFFSKETAQFDWEGKLFIKNGMFEAVVKLLSHGFDFYRSISLAHPFSYSYHAIRNN